MDRFDIICRHKDVSASNVNDVFESYGCSTLEAKIPIVDQRAAEQVKNANWERQHLQTLAFKSESGINAVEGRIPRTRDRPLVLVEIGQETVIAAGKQREKSPVDKGQLDTELEDYMKKTAALRAQKAKAREERTLALPPPSTSAQITQDIDPDWN